MFREALYSDLFLACDVIPMGKDYIPKGIQICF